MRALAGGVSMMVLASLIGGGQAQAEEAGEVGADEITCRQVAEMDAAQVPGVLYFVAGYREGAGEGLEGGDEAAASPMDDPGGELPGMEDATAAQERQVEDEPGPAAAGTEDDPLVEDVDVEEAEANGGEIEAAVEDGDGMEDAAVADADAEAARDMTAGEAEVTLVRVRGHFEIPIERTVLACADDPDALLADVIEEQRHADVAGETEPEED